MEASSETLENPMTAVGSRGWCGNVTKGGGVNWIKFTFDEPKTIERIRLEKIGADRSAFVTYFSLMYSKDVGAPLKPYQSENGTVSGFLRRSSVKHTTAHLSETDSRRQHQRRSARRSDQLADVHSGPRVELPHRAIQRSSVRKDGAVRLPYDQLHR